MIAGLMMLAEVAGSVHEKMEGSRDYYARFCSCSCQLAMTELDSCIARSLAHSLVALPDTCDIFTGRWIPDPIGPLYSHNSCRVLSQPQNCQANGRPDKLYEFYRWQPRDCDIPRLDPLAFLEVMKGKTLAFIGDSVARNQFESLMCVLFQVMSTFTLSPSSSASNSMTREGHLNDNSEFLAIFSTPPRYLQSYTDIPETRKNIVQRHSKEEASNGQNYSAIHIP